MDTLYDYSSEGEEEREREREMKRERERERDWPAHKVSTLDISTHTLHHNVIPGSFNRRVAS